MTLPEDEKRVLLALLYWNPDTGQLDCEGPDFMDSEELVAMLKLFDLKKAQCQKRG